MKVLQFTPLEEGIAEGDANFVYYSGTHDNDTLLGWYKTSELKDEENRKSESDEDDELKGACRRLIEELYLSQAAWVIIPMQDILGLDADTRMNVPGTIEGNWQWKLTKSLLTDEVRTWLRALAVTSERLSLNQFSSDNMA